jgi:hypothetical protein
LAGIGDAVNARRRRCVIVYRHHSEGAVSMVVKWHCPVSPSRLPVGYRSTGRSRLEPDHAVIDLG